MYTLKYQDSKNQNKKQKNSIQKKLTYLVHKTKGKHK